MGVVVSTVIFLLALMWFLLLRPTTGKQPPANRINDEDTTLVEESVSPFELIPDVVHEDDDVGAVSTIIVATLQAQKASDTPPAGGCPPRARDNFSIGYIGGYVDAILRRKRIATMRTGYTIGELVFVDVFGSKDGFSMYEKYLSLQHESDTEFFAGMAAGETDIEEWFKKKISAPFSWSVHVHGDTSAA